MPAKLTKYGIKVWMAAQSKNSYMINYDVYYGNENGFQRIHGLSLRCSHENDSDPREY